MKTGGNNPFVQQRMSILVSGFLAGPGMFCDPQFQTDPSLGRKEKLASRSEERYLPEI